MDVMETHMDVSAVSAREIEELSVTQRHHAFVNGAVLRLRGAVGGFESANRYVEAAARIGVLDERADDELGPRRGRLRRTLLQLMLMRIREEKRHTKRKGAPRRRTKTAATQARKRAQPRGKIRAHTPPPRLGAATPPLARGRGLVPPAREVGG